MSSECLFCRIVAGEIPASVVHETPTLLAFRDIAPKAPVHALIITKEHYADAATLSAAAPALAAELLAGTADVARAEGVADSGYRVVFNIGRDSGQEVPHVHAHVLGGARLGGGLAT